MTWRKIVIGAALIAVFAVGRYVLYLRSERYVLDHSDQFILYSLTWHSSPDVPTLGTFQRCGILGQTQITDPELRTNLVNALYGSIRYSGGEASCFNPRHGIHATYGGRTVDAVICFECEQVYFYENGQSNHQLISSEPQGLFNDALTAAHLPLSKRP
ncbi:hypothetical protein IAD21_00487 [Abditibacteriota bacterium]|nr:hypothetical protein IAD21_00487 [Abditibacteriota bacterium]